MAAEAAAPAARKRPAPDEAGAAEAGKKREALCKLENMDGYEMLEEIGGVAAKARDDDAVVKPVRGEGDDDDDAPDLFAAVSEAGSLAGAACGRHPDVVQAKDVAAPDGTAVDQVIGVELAGLTCSLRGRLTPPPQRFSENETRDAMRQLLRAAEKLHATGAVHLDINHDNILVGPGAGALKIRGFGPAGKTCPDPEKKPDGTSPLLYRSPEQLIRARRYGSEVDVWALGCVMTELLSCELNSVAYEEAYF